RRASVLSFTDDRIEKDRTLAAFMRDIRNRYFFIPPMNEENFLELGLPLHDTTRTRSSSPKKTAAKRCTSPCAGKTSAATPVPGAI
ncbi:MAG: hypothetical protein LBU85_12505, partial [Treponema sp.]|nr:hypothetical protein [Treponema sp.]